MFSYELSVSNSDDICDWQLGEREVRLREALGRQHDYQQSVQDLSRRLEQIQHQIFGDIDPSKLTPEELALKLKDNQVPCLNIKYSVK